MKMLMKIEKLDHQFPGLADSVRNWFAQGISAQKVSDLLREKYKVSVPRTDIAYFRARRWVPELELLREKRIAAQVAQEMEAMKASQGAA